MYFALLKSSHAIQKLSHQDTLACLPYTYVTFKDLNANYASHLKLRRMYFWFFCNSCLSNMQRVEVEIVSVCDSIHTNGQVGGQFLIKQLYLNITLFTLKDNRDIEGIYTV